MDRRLAEHVQRLGEEHPPIEPATVDFTVVDPVALSARYGHVLDYMARVELEVDRNVLELAEWQRWLVRRLRRLSYGPVGVNDDDQRADFGDVMISLGLDRDIAGFTESIARVERDLLWARGQGMAVPDYVVRAFSEAVEAALLRRTT